jgi:hypothetical protein
MRCVGGGNDGTELAISGTQLIMISDSCRHKKYLDRGDDRYSTADYSYNNERVFLECLGVNGD